MGLVVVIITIQTEPVQLGIVYEISSAVRILHQSKTIIVCNRYSFTLVMLILFFAQLHISFPQNC